MPTDVRAKALKESVPAPVASPQPESESQGRVPDQIRPVNSTYGKLQSMPQSTTTRVTESPAFVRAEQRAEQQDKISGTYQASRGGAEAARAPRSRSSTYTKLQALSASGTGAAGERLTDQGAGLDSLLDRLDSE